MDHPFSNIMKHIETGEKTILDGYIRFCNPHKEHKLVSIFRNPKITSTDVPFATTAFGDVFTWNEDGYIRLYKFLCGK